MEPVNFICILNYYIISVYKKSRDLRYLAYGCCSYKIKYLTEKSAVIANSYK